jgi:hypothetical protein
MQLIQFVNRLGESVEQGDVVIIGTTKVSHYVDQSRIIPIIEIDLSDRPYDTRVCGIVHQAHVDLRAPHDDASAESAAARPKKRGAARAELARKVATIEELGTIERNRVERGHIGYFVSHGAYAFCKVDADISPIRVGDLLTTSPTKGHAQKVTDRSKAAGAILGKALAPLKKGTGRIPVLVMLQ